jgi:hypothetical protein
MHTYYAHGLSRTWLRYMLACAATSDMIITQLFHHMGIVVRAATNIEASALLQCRSIIRGVAILYGCLP